MDDCTTETPALKALTDKLVSIIESCLPHENTKGAAKIMESLMTMRMYKGKLDIAIQHESRELILRAARGLTSTNKGLGDQVWTFHNADVTQVGWEITKAAIKAAACLGDSTS